MKPTHIIDTQQVIKNIDPLDVPAYRMRLIYQHRNDSKNASKANTGPLDTLRKRILSVSLFPNLYNRNNLLRHS
jgi:hypothetical protein